MLEELKMNLQLFAEDLDDDEFIEDETDDIDDVDLDDEEESEEDDADIDLEDTEESEEEGKEPLDKKTKAIIKHKKEAQELKRRLKELEEEKQASELEVEKANRISELTKDGKTSEEATRIADNEIEVKKLRLQLARFDIEKLENKYPGISAYASKLAEDKANLPEFTYEQLYQAKYAKQSKYDEKTKLEQELLAKNKEARKKSLESGSNKNTKTVKLSPEDERVYQYLKGHNKGLTRKRYKELLEIDEMEI